MIAAAGRKEVADYLRAHGWCQGTYQRNDGACCLAGAIQQVFSEKIAASYRRAAEAGDALGVRRDVDEAYNWKDRVRESIRTRIVAWSAAQPREKQLLHAGLLGFNDAPGRTLDEVLALLEGP